MRRPRLLAPKHHDRAYYHCVSRVVNREFVLQEEEKEQFVKFMRMYERLYGLRVLTFCIMSNHFHILLEVPKRPEADMSVAELIALVRECMGDERADSLEVEFREFEKMGLIQQAEALKERWLSKMWDVSSYMKVLKQRFTQWFNKKHGRRGTLWEDRFRSTLVQGESLALKTMAAYIDLNPVRAKICDDPKDYRWCGYAEAVAGQKLAQQALVYLVEHGREVIKKKSERQRVSKRFALEAWRRVLYGLPQEEEALEVRKEKVKSAKVAEEKAKRHGVERDGYHKKVATTQKRISREKALEVLEEGGKLSEAEYLRCKVRYFCDGAAIGARGFVEEVFQENREKFGEARKDGARVMRGLIGEKENRLYNLRNLQKRVFG